MLDRLLYLHARCCRWCSVCTSDQRTHCRSAAEGAPPPAGRGSGVIPCAGRDGSAPTPGWREGLVKVDEVLGGRRGARRSSEDYRRTAHSVRTGGSAADAHRCSYSFRFRDRQVSRRGGRSRCSRQRRARNTAWAVGAQGRARSSRRVTRMGGGGEGNPHGRWGRRVARAHLVTARPCPRRKPGHQRLSEVVS